MIRVVLRSVLLMVGVAVLACAGPGAARAELTMFAVDPAGLCDAAIGVAERAHSLPAHLLGAIGRVESGRRDPVSGALAPWPWTIDVEGEGHVYATEAQAIAAVQQYRAAGRRSIDVGCMQINLVQHADAFGSLAAAFDPVSNAEYAARFLTQLRDGAADWMAAAGLYHSATPGLAAEYRAKVAAMMQQAGDAPMLAMAPARSLFAMPMPAMAAAGSGLRGMVLRTAAQLSAPPVAAVGAGRGLAAYRAMAVQRRG